MLMLESKLLCSEWNYDEYLGVLTEDIADYGNQKRTEALHRVSKWAEKQILKGVEEPVKMLFGNPSVTLWKDIAEIQYAVSNNMVVSLNDKLASIVNSFRSRWR
jgi:hypothetical protein